MKGFVFLGLLISPYYFSQTIEDSLRTTSIQEVTLQQRAPMAQQVISVEKEIAPKNLGQDLPSLLKNQVSVVSTSDAGNGIGYSGIRVRGVAGNGINVMLNGVPYNDSESQGTFFVNMPDLTSSASHLEIQRGVGSSTNGVAAFGASINIVSKDPSEKFYMKSDNSIGSFGTYKYSAEIGSGKFWKDRISVFGRYSAIHSDGYIDRAYSDLESYNFTAMYKERHTELKFLAFGGNQTTYQAWNGIDRTTWEKKPKTNFSGAIYDVNWENIVGYYDNETDNYKQNHYHLHWKQKLIQRWSLETTIHYTRGKGYYENYKQGQSFSRYHLSDINGASYADFIRRKWLDNHFYGVVSSLQGKWDNVDLNFGLVINRYDGDHFGRVSGVQIQQIKDHEYYRNVSTKDEFSGYAKAMWKINNFEIFGDLQVRNIGYTTDILLQGDDEGVVLNKNWTFFNPKIGVNYRLYAGKLFFSYAVANREPNRDDLFANPETQSEQLHDFELGIEKKVGKFNIGANLYYMYYINQLVLNGKINMVGEFIRSNSGKSYRSGIELTSSYTPSEKWKILANVTLSQNKNFDFIIEEDGAIQSIGDTQISFSPNVIGNLTLQYRPITNLSLGFTQQYVGKQYLDNTENKEFQLRDYALLDFNVSYHLPIQRHDLTFNLLVNNLLDKKYVNNGYVYDKTPYYFTQAGLHFLFGVSWSFR